MGTGTTEDGSSTGHIWDSGFHHVTARTRLAGVLKLTNCLFILFSNFFSGRGELRIMNQQILWHTCAQLQEVPDSSQWDEVKSSLPLSLEVQSSNKSVIWSDKSCYIITNAL
jgi:hypothetical protein